MYRRQILALSALTSFGLALLAGNSVAQQSDIDAVRLVSEAYYPALAALDRGVSMEKVWAKTPYITYAGPRNKTFIVGWDALKQYYMEADKLLVERKISLSEGRIHVNGNVAWEIGHEIGQTTRSNGVTTKSDNLASRVYEKANGRWLMVSHHAQPTPQ